MATKAALRAASGADCMVVAAARARLGGGGWSGSGTRGRGGRRLRVHAPKPLLRLHTQANMKGTGPAVLAGLGWAEKPITIMHPGLDGRPSQRTIANTWKQPAPPPTHTKTVALLTSQAQGVRRQKPAQ
jgi:hypothetical protein